ncbi:MAG: phenylalanine--tRNA ligase subunit alpha, partial [Gammaproteobacteria bacterium]
MSALDSLLREAEAEVRAAGDLQQLDAVRVKYLGKKGLLTEPLK